jgi:hypothetical protein
VLHGKNKHLFEIEGLFEVEFEIARKGTETRSLSAPQLKSKNYKYLKTQKHSSISVILSFYYTLN